MKRYLFLFLLSFLAILTHGYQFAYSDQEIVIPYILKSADQALFSGDYLFNQSSAHLSLFYPVVGFLTKFINIEIVFFVGYLVFQFVFFTAIYRLSKVLLNDKNLAYFSLLPFFLPKFIGGTATQTFDLFFGYRSVGLIFLILYISFLIEKKFIKSFIIALLGIFFHPLSIIPSLLTFPVLFLSNSKSKIKDTLKIISGSLLLLTLSYLLLGKSFFASLFTKDDLWYSIIKFRDSYVFSSTWLLLGWAAFFIYFALIALFLNNLKKDIKYSAIYICFVAIVIFLVNSILLQILKLPGFAQFQIVRSITPVAYIALTISPLFLTFKNKVLRILGFLAYIFLCLNLYYLFAISVTLFTIAFVITKDKIKIELSKYYLFLVTIIILAVYFLVNINSYLNIHNMFQFPKKEDDWIILQKWVNQNTDKYAKFLIPLDETGFRIFSARSIVGDAKDGAVVIYNPQYASYWSTLMTDTSNYELLKDQDFLLLKKKYYFNYLITKTSQKVNLEIIYKNNSYILYKI